MVANNDKQKGQTTRFTRSDEPDFKGGQVDRSEHESVPYDEEKGLVDREEYEQDGQEVDDSEGNHEDEDAKNNS